jgi:hypothetical protein
VRFNDAFADGKPQTGPAGPAGPFGDRNAVELVEDPFQIMFRHAGTMIGHLQSQPFPVNGGTDLDHAIHRGILVGIVNQVHQYLGHQHQIHGYQWKGIGEPDLDLAVADALLNGSQGTTDQILDIARLAIHAECFCYLVI